MDLLADRGRRVSLEELNTSRLLAHARQQAVKRGLDDILIVDVDGHHYENECFDEFLPLIENDVLRVEGRVDFGNYEGMEPLYTEYNVGHFARAFTLSSKIDQQQITAKVEDGVLTLTLKKAREAMPRRITVS